MNFFWYPIQRKINNLYFSAQRVLEELILILSLLWQVWQLACQTMIPALAEIKLVGHGLGHINTMHSLTAYSVGLTHNSRRHEKTKGRIELERKMSHVCTILWQV